MIRYIIYRILGLLGVLFVVTIITFSLMHAVPGGPFDEEKMPLSAEAKANILRKYGLDRPLYEQYSRYMWNAIQFDFGIPFQSPGETVTDLIARTWPISMQLGGMGLALAFAGGILLGILFSHLLLPYIKILSEIAGCYVHAYPNAGLPNAMGEYDETSEIMGEQLKEWI